MLLGAMALALGSAPLGLSAPQAVQAEEGGTSLERAQQILKAIEKWVWWGGIREGCWGNCMGWAQGLDLHSNRHATRGAAPDKQPGTLASSSLRFVSDAHYQVAMNVWLGSARTGHSDRAPLIMASHTTGTSLRTSTM